MNEDRQIAKLRFKSGLAPLVRKDRKCLCCEQKFMSDGAHHRLCDMCKIKGRFTTAGLRDE